MNTTLFACYMLMLRHCCIRASLCLVANVMHLNRTQDYHNKRIDDTSGHSQTFQITSDILLQAFLMLDSSSDYCTFSSQHAVDSFSIDFYVVMHSVCFVFPPCGRIHISMYRAVHIIRCVNCNKYQVFEKLTFRSHDLI